jgi:hypothetical protein
LLARVELQGVVVLIEPEKAIDYPVFDMLKLSKKLEGYEHTQK